ncbi:MAG TPA: ATP-dependent zinc protease [Acidimicrobiaceae bacterium]|nr:ATP-dependent zinc protease [Acidimicrobiaceae bacterium]
MTRQRLLVIGWREWITLSGLECPTPIKAKIDTGAATSALHASKLERFEVYGQPWVRFTVRPHQRRAGGAMRVEAPVIDERRVRSSNGKSELRPVIETEISLGEQVWNVEFTLTRRNAMGFRMLLGRRALRRRAVVDVSSSYRLGAPPSHNEEA